MNNSIEIQLINTSKNDMLSKIIEKLNNMTINDLIIFYNKIKPQTDNTTNFKDIINVDYLFEHNIASFVNLNDLLELRLVNKSFKSIIYNSKTSIIFNPQTCKSIEIISNIFKTINNWKLSWRPCNSILFYKYMKNIVSNSLNILFLTHCENIDNLIVKYLSNAYSSNKLKELYLLDTSFHIKTIYTLLRYYSTGYDTFIRSNIEKLYIYSSNLQDFYLIPQIKGIKSIYLNKFFQPVSSNRGYLWIDEIENYKFKKESYENFKIIDDNMKKSIIDEAISKGYILEKDIDIIYKNLIKKDISISDMFKNIVSLCINNINNDFILSIPHLKNLKTLDIEKYSGYMPIISDTLETVKIGFKNNPNILMDLLLYMPNIVDIGIEIVNFFLPKFPSKILNKVVLDLKYNPNNINNINKSNIKCKHLIIKDTLAIDDNNITIINQYTNYINDLLDYIDHDTLINLDISNLNSCKIFIDKLNLFTNIKKLLFNDRVFVCENNKNSHLLLRKSPIKDHLITKSIQEYQFDILEYKKIDPIANDIINNTPKGTIIQHYHSTIPLIFNNFLCQELLIIYNLDTSNYDIIEALEEFYHNTMNFNIKITIHRYDSKSNREFAKLLKRTYNIDCLLTDNKYKNFNITCKNEFNIFD